MKLRFRVILLAFCLSFTLLVALTIYATRHFVAFSNSTAEVDKSNKAITQLHILEALLKDIDLYETALPLKKNDSETVSRYLKKHKEINGNIASLEHFSAGKTQHNTTIMLRSNLTVRKSVLRKRLSATDTAAIQQYDSIISSLRKEADMHIEKMLNTEYIGLKQSFNKRNTFRYEAAETIIYLLSVFYIVTLLLFVLIIYELKANSRYQDELHANLIDLRNAHLELEQVAFSMSHHLKEPIRKIKIFSDKYLHDGSQMTQADIKNVLEKIDSSAARMQVLISELEHLTSLQGNDTMEKVYLEETAAAALKHYKQQMDSTGARILLNSLPVVQGNKEQLTILFDKLFDNAFKFARKDVTLQIKIYADMIAGHTGSNMLKVYGDKKFYRVVFEDNGIGFENIFSQKIFDLFQKLNSEYPGKGTGLSIARRIMANHKGFITARAQAGKGAEFHLYFPVPGP